MKINQDYFLVFGIIAIIAYIIVRSVYNNKKHKEKSIETLCHNDMEELFFEKIRGGSNPYKILNIYIPFDLIIIKSLLLSEQIPYYVEFEHTMGLRQFIQIINYTNTNLYILEEDYEDTVIVLRNYIRTKTLDNYTMKERIRNIVEMLVFGWLILSPQNNLGIDIRFKENK